VAVEAEDPFGVGLGLGVGLDFHERVRWCESRALIDVRRSASSLSTIAILARWCASFGIEHRVSATPWVSGRARATAMIRSRCSGVVFLGRPPR